MCEGSSAHFVTYDAATRKYYTFNTDLSVIPKGYHQFRFTGSQGLTHVTLDGSDILLAPAVSYQSRAPVAFIGNSGDGEEQWEAPVVQVHFHPDVATKAFIRKFSVSTYLSLCVCVRLYACVAWCCLFEKENIPHY